MFDKKKKPTEAELAAEAATDARTYIDGSKVGLMIIEFWNTCGDAYLSDTTESALCAVGPLQAMIGLAIKNGHLKVAE